MADPERVGSAVPRDPMREALRQSEEHFRQLVSGVEDYAIFLLSPDGHVASWNSGAHRIKGYSADEIIGQHVSRFYSPEAIAEGTPERELGIAREQGRFADETWRLRKDGSRFWASVTISRLIGEGGTLRGFLKITRDLSERRAAEERLRQSEEKFRLLVEGVQEYAIFMLSPDGNVASWSQAAERIKGWQTSEILGRHFSCFYPPEAVAAGKPAWHLQVALKQGFLEDQGPRLRKDGQQFWANVVITALRDTEGRHVGFAKVTRDLTDRRRQEEMARRQAELRKEPVDLAVVILSAIETSRPVIEEASHDLQVTLPPDKIVLDADPVRLGQVISNLLNNAAKYTQERGHLRLSAYREGNEAVISVRDDGLGIPPDMLPRVFDMFAQVDRTLKRAQGGLGIGPALAQSLVELHGGRIEAKSKGLDQGSEFVVRLPIVTSRREAAAESRSGGQPAMSIAPGRILVVDDSRDGADSLGMVLKMMGADADVVYDGPAALEAVHASHPAVVLLDIGMPGMDGYEVAARIRADPAFNDVRLVALTGWGSEEERRRSREAGFDDHWVKPVDPGKLRELLAPSAD